MYYINSFIEASYYNFNIVLVWMTRKLSVICFVQFHKLPFLFYERRRSFNDANKSSIICRCALQRIYFKKQFLCLAIFSNFYIYYTTYFYFVSVVSSKYMINERYDIFLNGIHDTMAIIICVKGKS